MTGRSGNCMYLIQKKKIILKKGNPKKNFGKKNFLISLIKLMKIKSQEYIPQILKINLSFNGKYLSSYVFILYFKVSLTICLQYVALWYP